MNAKARPRGFGWPWFALDRKSTRLNSSHSQISYAVFCLKKKKIKITLSCRQQLTRLHNPSIHTLAALSHSLSLGGRLPVDHIHLRERCSSRRYLRLLREA